MFCVCPDVHQLFILQRSRKKSFNTYVAIKKFNHYVKHSTQIMILAAEARVDIR